MALADAERDLSLAHPDARIERFLLRGRPASLIVQEARDFAADLIVVGHRGHGTIETMVLGSVSAEVVDHAPCAGAGGAIRGAGPDRLRGRRVAERAGSRRPSSNSLPLPPGAPITVLTVTDTGFPYETAASPALYGAAMAQYGESLG